MNTSKQQSSRIEGLKVLDRETLIPKIATDFQPGQQYEITETRIRRFLGENWVTKKRWEGDIEKIINVTDIRARKDNEKEMENKRNVCIHKEPTGFWTFTEYPMVKLDNKWTLIKNLEIERELQKGNYYVEINPKIGAIECFLIPKKEWTDDMEQKIRLHTALAHLNHYAAKVDVEMVANDKSLSFHDRVNLLGKNREPVEVGR